MRIEEFRNGRPRVLVVEDEPRMRELLLDVVPEMGFETEAVKSAEDARRAMVARASDILLLDLNLPVMGGMDFFEQVRAEWPATQVVIMTGFGDLASAQRAIRLDAADFVTKPFHLRDIEVALDRAKRRLKVEPEIAPPEVEPEPITLADRERRVIMEALARHHGNRTAAANELGISRRKLQYWLRDNGDL